MSGDDDFMAFIGPRKGVVGPDMIMAQVTNPPSKGHHGPASVSRINVDEIIMGPRKRDPIPSDVAALKADIEQIGLLQPIGVKRDLNHAARYILIWGASRLAAYQQGWEEAKKLLDQKGIKDEMAFRQAKIWQQIPAIVFDREIPADLAERREIAENLIRTELSTEERSIQRARYVALVAKQGRVATAGQVRNANKEATVTRRPHGAADENKLETATTKAARDLGVSRDTLQRDTKRVEAMANVAAKAAGQEPVRNLTPESSAEELDRAARLAERTARMIRAEKAAGRGARHIAPVQPTGDTVMTVRIDLTDPKKAAAWFKGRVTAPDKPLTTAFLRELAAELIKAADELDATPEEKAP